MAIWNLEDGIGTIPRENSETTVLEPNMQYDTVIVKSFKSDGYSITFSIPFALLRAYVRYHEKK